MQSRTMESGYCMLAGMYPPSGDQIWNPNLLWQPIPVYTRSLNEDPVSDKIISLTLSKTKQKSSGLVLITCTLPSIPMSGKPKFAVNALYSTTLGFRWG